MAAKKYTNADLAQAYLKFSNSSSDMVYKTSLKIDSAKIDIPQYFSENKSLNGLEIEGLYEGTIGLLEEILSRRQDRLENARLKAMRKNPDAPRKLNYNLIPRGRGNIK